MSEEGEPYYLAFRRLARDRPYAGAMPPFPRAVPQPAVEAENRRLAELGDPLDGFVEIVMAIDDYAVEIEMKRLAADANRQKQQARMPRR